jgi:chromosome segregation ATPase
MMSLKAPRKISTIIIIISSITLIAAVAFFVSKSKRLSLELNSEKTNLENLHKEISELKNNYAKLETDYARSGQDRANLENKVQELTDGRDNLREQIKALLPEKDKVAQLADELEKIKKDLGFARSEKKDIIDQNLLLKEKIKDLNQIQKQIIQEKNKLNGDLETALAKSGVKKLEQENAAFKNENAKLTNDFKLATAEADKLRDSQIQLKQENEKLASKLNQMNKDYSELVRKNNEFAKKVGDAPAKLVELARQNRILIKRTSNMHYNLGVFYTNQKDYSRAVAEFEKALELTPDDPYVHFNLGYIYAEYMVNRPKAMEHFRQYLRYAKSDDKDVDWVKKYILTWQTFDGKQPME